MKILVRILSYSKPLRIYLPQYLVYTFFGVIFGLINLTLLKPLFDIIFKQMDPGLMELYSNPPEWELSLDYVIHLFYYHFIQASEKFGSFGSLVFVCTIIIFSNLLANVFRYLSMIMLAIIRSNTVKNIRQHIFETVSHLHLGFFSNERKGDIMSRITNDVQEIENSITLALEVVFRDPLTIILSFVYLFIVSPNLTLFTLILLPVAGGIITVIARKLRKTAKITQEILGRIVNETEEMISGLRIIKAFNATRYINRQFRVETCQYAHTYISFSKKRELASPLSEFVGVIFIAGIVVYGGSLILNQESVLDASGFLTYIIIFAQVLNPAKNISKAVAHVQRAIASGDRIFKIIDTKPAIVNSKDPVRINSFEKEIEFRNVSFSYENTPVLKNINLRIPKGKTIALVGPSGGGKSTLADLIPRFYDIDDGELLLDGIPVKNIGLQSLRDLLGIVTQESILFNDTIFNNIAFGLDQVKEEDVIRAAKISNAHDFIMQTEKGYYTNIGERGSKLSGGQRQRISIARAVLKNPPILILDEATSALDSESEKLVQEALNNLMRNRTAIVIAHRLSTIQNADKIIVIQDGSILAVGTHQELLRNDRLYKKLSEMQSF
ncbi:MAG: ABC transporter ATP-binding protein [Cyclobacteriaceae bacterium]|nr:ABC transporter ATP-binding protein [Cyclobacteriaceae bacterium]